MICDSIVLSISPHKPIFVYFSALRPFRLLDHSTYLLATNLSCRKVVQIETAITLLFKGAFLVMVDRMMKIFRSIKIISCSYLLLSFCQSQN